ncbi:MAG: hemolysin family protein [Fimbriimonadaceae bacterium]
MAKPLPAQSNSIAENQGVIFFRILLSLVLIVLLAFGFCGLIVDFITAESPISPVMLSIIWGLFLFSLLATWLSSAARSALANLKSVHIKALLEDGEPYAKVLEKMHKEKAILTTSLFVTSVLSVSGLTVVVAGFIINLLYLEPFRGPSSGEDLFVWVLIYLIGSAIVLLFPAALVSNAASLGEAHPVDTSRRLSWFSRSAGALFYAFSWVYNQLFVRSLNLYSKRQTFVIENEAEEELMDFVESAEQSGAIEEEQTELLRSAIEFTETVAREVMTPRVDLNAVPRECSLEEAATLIQQTGHSRLPVYEGTDDEIVGIVHAKDLLQALAKQLVGQRATVSDYMRPAFFVPENKMVQEVLKDMKQNKTQMVVVRDEFGGTAGIVTAEDILEELVGEIVDEYDTEEPDVHQIDNGWNVSGRLNLDDLNHEIDAGIESDEFDTIGGYVFGLFGRQPTLGESVEDDLFVFTVTDTDGRRILRLDIRRRPEGTLPD